MANLKFQRHDGGRREAGYVGSTGDCVTRALCINLGMDYAETYKTMTRRQNEYVRSTAGIKATTVSRAEEAQGISQGVNVAVYGQTLSNAGWKRIRVWKITPRQAMARYGKTIIIKATTTA